MLRTDRFFYLAFVLVATAAAAGCGDNGVAGSGGSTSSSGSTSASSSSASSGAGGAACMGGADTVLAINKLYFGDGNNGEWKKFGANVDGIASTPAMPGAVCKPMMGADPNKVNTDGDNGIDNSFGANILPSLLFVDPMFAADTNTSIQAGNFTVMLKMACLPTMGDAPSLVTKLFGGTALGSAPKFDGTDMWPVSPDLLKDPKDLDSSTVVFDKSSVTSDAFDSGKNQTFILTVPVNAPTGSTAIKLTIHAAQVTMTLAPDRKTAKGGMISGVLNTEEFIAEAKKVGYLNNICNSPVFTNVTNSIRQASDILSDGTQDPAKPCDGISIGIGFDMAPVQIGSLGPAPMMYKACP